MNLLKELPTIDSFVIGEIEMWLVWLTIIIIITIIIISIVVVIDSTFLHLVRPWAWDLSLLFKHSLGMSENCPLFWLNVSICFCIQSGQILWRVGFYRRAKRIFVERTPLKTTSFHSGSSTQASTVIALKRQLLNLIGLTWPYTNLRLAWPNEKVDEGQKSLALSRAIDFFFFSSISSSSLEIWGLLGWGKVWMTRGGKRRRDRSWRQTGN